MKTELPYRHEFKYRCTAAQLQVLKGRLDAVMALDSHAGAAGYTIRSMYFDNYENQYYYENENGTDPREKYRIRIYNADASRITLECKRKEHTKTLKTICPLTLEQFRGIMDGCCPFSDSDSAKLLNRFLYLQKTECLKPAVIVEYDRIPYVCTAGNVRITLDQKLRTGLYSTDLFNPNLPTYPVFDDPVEVLEVKYDELLPGYIKQVLNLDNLQQITFSKYYLCRKISLGGTL